KREGVGKDRLVDVDAVVHPQPRRRKRRRAFFILKGQLQLLVGTGDPSELVDEVHVPRGTAKLAVGGGLKAELFLEGDDVVNGAVFSLSQGVGTDFTFAESAPRLEQLGRPKKTADVVGAKRWSKSLAHDHDSTLSRVARTLSVESARSINRDDFGYHDSFRAPRSS